MKTSKISLLQVVITICLFFNTVVLIRAQPTTIEVSGDITENTTWTDDTVKVMGDITVLDDIILTVNPGTYVEFQGSYALIILGTIKSEGLHGDSIHFTAKSHTEGWLGIRFLNSTSGANGNMNDNDSSIIARCVFSYGIGISDTTEWGQGMAIHSDNFSKLVVRQSRFHHNSAKWSGGAIQCVSSSFVIKQCYFHNNVAEVRGGAIYLRSVYDMVISQCTFNNNTGKAGGALAALNSSVKIEENVVINNQTVEMDGGGIWSSGSEVRIVNNLIANNYSQKNGGGISLKQTNGLLGNNTIANNEAGKKGGAIHSADNSDIALFNSILSGNIAPKGREINIGDDQSSPLIVNSVMEFGKDSFFLSVGITYTADYIDNILANPGFVSPSPGHGVGLANLDNDWSVQGESICINEGMLDAYGSEVPDRDLAGKNRVIYGTIDIGSMEYLNPNNIYIENDIKTDTKWMADTIFITKDFEISDSTKLTILPGEKVVFKGFYKLTVKGSLQAMGTETEPILFTASDTSGFHNNTHTGWNGVKIHWVNYANDSTVFKHCIFEYGKRPIGGSISLLGYNKVRLSHCIMRNNYAEEKAGGININSSNGLLENCEITTNISGGTGGGIDISRSAALLINCNISNNRSKKAGGIFFHDVSNSKIVNCIISNNVAEYVGGIKIEDASPSFYNSIIANNKTLTKNGGGLEIVQSFSKFYNTNIINNWTKGAGGGARIDAPLIEFYNCIIRGNQADFSDPQIHLISGSNPSFIHCNIEGGRDSSGIESTGLYSGLYLSNLDKNPEFITGMVPFGRGWNLHEIEWLLSDFSPCINAGETNTPGFEYYPNDLLGQLRINGIRIDIGAIENQGRLPTLIKQPANIFLCKGEQAVFKIETIDTARYQWQKDGIDIEGATNQNFVIESSKITDEGNYQCIISNAYGELHSNFAYLLVRKAPEIMIEPKSQWLEVNEPFTLRTYVDGTPPISYQWQKDGMNIPGANTPEYSITDPTLSDEGNYICAISNSCGEVTTTPATFYLAPQICMVTVDDTTGNNLVVWEKNSIAPISYYNVYRESNYSGIYDLLASIPFDMLSTYEDATADPRSQAYLYRITATDTSGYETDIDLCKTHKTIHLLATKNAETNATQLEWDRYVGFDYGTYEIFRSDTTFGFNIIRSLSSSISAWTDTNRHVKYYYRVAAVKTDTCFPTGGKTKAGVGPYVHALSNMDDNKLLSSTGAREQPSLEQINIFPNPMSSSSTIQFTNPSNDKYQLSILDLSGKIYKIVNDITTSKYVLKRGEMKPGLYFIELRGPKIYRGKIVVK